MVVDKACRYLRDRELSDVVSVNNHDVGVYVSGVCSLSDKSCRVLIPDFPVDFEYDFHVCVSFLDYFSLKK
jgi:hypothetical protein